MVALGFIVIALSGTRTRGNKYDYNKGHVYRWDDTKFDPEKDSILIQSVEKFKVSLADGNYGNERENRDRIIPYGSENSWIYTWVHCSTDGIECAECFHYVYSLMDQCCIDYYGFYFKSEDCEMRYEIYLFSV
ncbi:hypothetical protein LINPERPRIM_LOCUS8950 [Linum perenne]